MAVDAADLEFLLGSRHGTLGKLFGEGGRFLGWCSFGCCLIVPRRRRIFLERGSCHLLGFLLHLLELVFDDLLYLLAAFAAF